MNANIAKILRIVTIGVLAMSIFLGLIVWALICLIYINLSAIEWCCIVADFSTISANPEFCLKTTNHLFNTLRIYGRLVVTFTSKTETIKTKLKISIFKNIRKRWGKDTSTINALLEGKFLQTLLGISKIK